MNSFRSSNSFEIDRPIRAIALVVDISSIPLKEPILETRIETTIKQRNSMMNVDRGRT